MTVQGVPEGVGAPVVSALGPRTLHVSWEAPSKPNGIVREYRVNQTGVGLVHTHSHGELEHTVHGTRISVCVFYSNVAQTFFQPLYKQYKQSTV